jgi:hypothetical protein
MSLLPYGYTKRMLSPLQACQDIDAVRAFVLEQFTHAEEAGTPLHMHHQWDRRNIELFQAREELA